MRNSPRTNEREFLSFILQQSKLISESPYILDKNKSFIPWGPYTPSDSMSIDEIAFEDNEKNDWPPHSLILHAQKLQ